MGIPVGQVYQIGQAANGKLWMAETSRSVRPIPLGVPKSPPDETEIRVGSTGVVFDRDGALWITTIGDGLRRAGHPERLTGKPDRFSKLVESYTVKDGLTDDYAVPILEDHEGNIWVGTNAGLDRFRKSSFVRVALPVPTRTSLMVAGDRGDLWVEGANSWWVRVIDNHAIIKGPEIVTIHKILTIDIGFRVAHHDSWGTVWWLGGEKLVRFENGRFTEFRLPEALSFRSGLQDIRLAEDRSGVLWVAASNAGLFSMKNGAWKRFEPPSAIAGITSPETSYTDWMGRVWFGYRGGAILVIDNGDIPSISSKGSFENVTAINGRDRHIWVGGDFGLAFYDGSRFQPVVPEDAQTLGVVWGIEEDRDGGLWLGEYSNVVHVAPNEIQHFLHDPSYRVSYERFDSLDGLPGKFRFRSGLGAQESQGTDGKIWFATMSGLAWLDPAHISRNPLPPPVTIRSLTADGKTYPHWKNPALPSLMRSLRIQFTALSLSIPERVRFRYRLDGFDSDWQDAGARREALYTNLSPRKYRFRVIASNNDGIWNETGATLDFSVLPAWHQTIWFRSLCVAALLALLWAFYQFRLYQVQRQFNVALEARVNERTRIARELHDTLLQSLHGLLFRVQAAKNLFPARPEEAIEALDGVIVRTEQAIAESQDAITGLRPGPTASSDLGGLLMATGKELENIVNVSGAPLTFGLIVEGERKTLSPILQEEIYRIARELLRNAFRHACAHHVEAEVRYDEEQLRMRIRDDGKGMDPEVLKKGRRQGHWGLPGVKERAQQIGAQLDFWSEAGAGTEVQLSIPAKIAYKDARDRPRAHEQ